ncbi:G-type lectin S-receptor-like serine/threonine-protein kinase [Thalictrum thalictroides]|uniref:G-type lectin S-receptor-like serine/threonine-protein kinase n=1 Tax=Thalictrum thalictroides TaxID=46969 RepID=A0A7J6VKU8_THATH|nr:G-type lectin S-receptor-like serine/threonine-protein kinase [Thalictrum thalictroides]
MGLGYEPASIDEWSKGNRSSGCVKRKPFRCEQNNSRSKERKEDGFILHERMKFPDHMVNWVHGDDVFGRELDDCKQTCLRNCFCRAYSHANGGCMWWHENLIDMQKFSFDGVDLYIHVSHSELVLARVLVFTVCMCIFRRWAMKRKRKTYMRVLVLDESATTIELTDTDTLDPELPIFKYDMLAVSTNNFDLANKLGEGQVAKWARNSCKKTFEELWTRHRGIQE